MYTGSIYEIFNIVNSKKYVGQAIDYERRWKAHINELNRNGKNDYNKHFQNAWNKYGQECFMFIILETVEANTQEELQNKLNELEKQYIREWNLLDDRYGYNVAEGGHNGYCLAGYTEEQRKVVYKKQSETMKEKYANGYVNPNKGKHISEEQKQRLREIHLGKSPTQEAIEKGRLKRIGKHYHTKESKAKISEANKGKIVSQETKEKLSNSLKQTYANGYENPRKGKHPTQETKHKMSENHADFTGSKHPKAKSVIMLDMNNKPLAVFDYINQAKQYIGKGDINACLRGGTKSAGRHPITNEKLQWKYITITKL